MREREKRRCSFRIAICPLQIQHAAAAAAAAAFRNVSLVLCLGRSLRKCLRPVHFFA